MDADRRLSLRRDALTELTQDELVLAVAAGVPETLPPTGCLSLKPQCSWSCPAPPR